MREISKAMQQVRQERREAKNTEKKLQPIIEWVQNNQKTIHDLQRLLGTVRAQEASVNGRLYNPKTDILGRIFGDKQK